MKTFHGIKIGHACKPISRAGDGVTIGHGFVEYHFGNRSYSVVPAPALHTVKRFEVHDILIQAYSNVTAEIQPVHSILRVSAAWTCSSMENSLIYMQGGLINKNLLYSFNHTSSLPATFNISGSCLGLDKTTFKIVKNPFTGIIQVL